MKLRSRSVLFSGLIGIVVVGALWLAFRSTKDSFEPVQEELSDANLSPKGEGPNAATGRVDNGFKISQNAPNGGAVRSSVNQSNQATGLQTAHATMAAEMEHALSFDSASESMKATALNEKMNIESRLKAVTDLETTKPRGFVRALIAVSQTPETLVRLSAVGALGRSYFPEALSRLSVMAQEKSEHPSVRSGVLSAITSLAEAASKKSIYPGVDSDAAAVVAKTRAILLKQIDEAAKLRDGSAVSTTIQILNALSYLECPEVVVLIQAKLMGSYADLPERDTLVKALGRSGFPESKIVLQEYQNQLEEQIEKISPQDSMILQPLRNSLALVQETLKKIGQ